MKRLFVIGFSCGVFFWDRVWRLCLRVSGKRAPGTCVVLQYHTVPGELRTKFAHQMDILRRSAIPVRADSHAPLAASQHYVVVTFDDGLNSFAENVLPELEKRNIPAALFVVAGKLGTVPTWTSFAEEATWASVSHVLPGERMLTADELREISGKVVIGSHSSTHRMLTELDKTEARGEIEDSRRQLEAIVGTKVALFSFPYGEFSKDLLGYCKDAGYDRVFTSLPALALGDPQEFVSGRVQTDPTDSPLELRLKMWGCYRWLPYAFSVKRALFKTLAVRLREAKPVQTP
jgi:peptidoglycan/xylan/chitin deacetylase (PgdA/CDA1 family)